MRKLSIHPGPVLLLLFLFSGSVQPTSPLTEPPGTPGVAAATSLTATSDDGMPPWCVLSRGTVKCPDGMHWASKNGDIDEWDGGDHNTCWPKKCAWTAGADGKHPQCAFAQLAPMKELDEAVWTYPAFTDG